MKKIFRSLLITCLLFANHSAASAQRVNHRARLFDSYGWINSEDAGARLDNFAIQLLNEPGSIGYAICYGPEGEGSGTGRFILQVTKDYLVNTRGFEEERIQTIYGGRYKDQAEVETELWIVPQGEDAPEPRRYKNSLKQITGKFKEYDAWDDFAEAADAPSLGNVTLAALADILREQPNTVAYIVAFNLRRAVPGTWRRVAKRDAGDLQGYGISADRIKIIFGGIVKEAKSEDTLSSQQAKIELWILPNDAQPPVTQAKPESTPAEATQIGSYSSYALRYPKDERWIFEGFADVLQADEQLNVFIIVRPTLGVLEKYDLPDEPPDIDPLKLVENWKSELIEKYKIKENRITVIQAAADEMNEGTVDVWVVPTGAALPDPYDSHDSEIQ